MRQRTLVVAFTFMLAISIASAQNTSSSSNGTQKQTSSLPLGPIIGGDGTPNYIPLWRASTYLQNSVLYQSGGNVGLGTTTPQATLDVNGSVNVTSGYKMGGVSILSTAPSLTNVYFGNLAGSQNTSGNFNTFVGIDAGQVNTTGFANTFLGAQAGYENSTGSNNTYSGALTGYYTTTGEGNTFSGNGAGFANTTGSLNTFIGLSSGYLNVNGNSNVFLGVFAGRNNMYGNNNIYIGNEGPSAGSESNTIRLGGDTGLGVQTSTYIDGIYSSVASSGIPVYVNSNGQLGTQTSSLRFKEQVRDMGDSTDALMRLRPVTFLYKPDYANGERTLQYGLIAEEVAKVYPELVAYDNEGQPYSVRYQYLSTMLLNEVQKQYRRAESEAQVIKTQEEKIDALEQRLNRLEKLIGPQANASERNLSQERTTGGTE